MMFNSKCVASVKANGKILREFKDTVYLPFGAEYSLLIKNLNSVRMLFNVYIDGENHTPQGFVLYPGQEIDLERSLKNGSLTQGNKFKFIERSGAVEAHRGIKLEDGIVRIEYQFERYIAPPPYIPNTMDKYPLKHPWDKDPWIDSPLNTGFNHKHGDRIVRSMMLNNLGNVSEAGGSSQSVSYTSCSVSNNIATETTFTSTASVNDAGITVPGSQSTQSFGTASSFPMENEKHSIVLKLLGANSENKPVTAPVTVKSKPRCKSCNRQNKATAKFCVECGTHLTIYA